MFNDNSTSIIAVLMQNFTGGYGSSLQQSTMGNAFFSPSYYPSNSAISSVLDNVSNSIYNNSTRFDYSPINNTTSMLDDYSGLLFTGSSNNTLSDKTGINAVDSFINGYNNYLSSDIFGTPSTIGTGFTSSIIGKYSSYLGGY